MKKYKLTDEYIIIDGRKLYRIEALKDFGDIHKGDKGGFIESEENLSHFNNCWIYYNAKVFSNAKVSGNVEIWGSAEVHDSADIYGNARIWGSAEIYGNARVYNSAEICGNAKIFDNAEICDSAMVWDNAIVRNNAIIRGTAEIYGNAEVSNNTDYIVFKNWWSSGRYFTWTRSNNMWRVGCFYGTGEELIEKAYKDSELSGREYERIVKYVESILKEE